MRVITGTARGRRLNTPEGMDIRPTTDNVKESIFNIISFEIEGRKVLDLFAGTGQLGIEALSRGARECVFIDSSVSAVNIIKENLSKCGFNAQVLHCDALSYLNKCDKFDIIFVDPPYDSNLYEAVLDRVESFDLLNDGGIIVTECRRERIMPDLSGIYSKNKEYCYGKVKVVTYKKGN